MGVCGCVLNKHADLFLFTHSRSKSQRGLVREQTELVVASASGLPVGKWILQDTRSSAWTLGVLSLCRQVSAVVPVEREAPWLPASLTSPVTFGQGWTELSDFEKVKRLLFCFLNCLQSGKD